MRSTKSKKQKVQIPLKQGRAAEAIASTLSPLLNNFFDSSSFDDNEVLLAELLQSYISPDPNSILSNERIANTVHAVRNINNLLRALEALNSQVKGGSLCV